MYSYTIGKCESCETQIDYEDNLENISNQAGTSFLYFQPEDDVQRRIE